MLPDLNQSAIVANAVKKFQKDVEALKISSEDIEKQKRKHEDQLKKYMAEVTIINMDKTKLSGSSPYGKHEQINGGKVTTGKPRGYLTVGYLGKALLEVAEVSTYGAVKYKVEGYLEVEDGEAKYLDAAIRHLLISGSEEIDPESGLSHLAHAACSLLISNEIRLRRIDKVKVADEPVVPFSS